MSSPCSPRRQNPYARLLRESVEIEAIRLALRNKDNLSALATASAKITIKQGPSFGAVHVVYEVARSLAIDQALGSTRDGRLALWQVIARVIDQGSRLHY
jgi:hypothetical protein